MPNPDFAQQRLRPGKPTLLVLFLGLLFLMPSFSYSARIYWIGGAGTTNNWNDTSMWSNSSGGSSCTCTPGSSDEAYFDGGGTGGVIVNVNVTISSLTATSAYTNIGANDGHIDNTTNDQTMTITNSVTLDNKQVSMGNSTTWNVGGDWDSNDVTTFNDDTSTLDMDGSGPQSMTGTQTLYNLRIINTAGSPGDSIDVDASAFDIANTLTITDGQFQPATGFSARNITFGSSGILKPDASATIYISGNWTNSAGGTFTHNNGTVEFEGSIYNSFLNVATSETFNGLIVDKDSTRYIDITNGDTLIVEGTLNLQDGYATNGTFEAKGDVTVNATAWDGTDTSTLTFTGTGAQGLNSSSTLMDDYEGNIFVNKPSGVLTLQDDVSIIGTSQDFTVQSGELDIADKKLTIDDAGTGNASFFSFESGTVTVGTGGELEIADGYYAQSGGIFNLNAGTFDYNESVVDVDINAGTFNANTGTFETGDDLDISGTAQFNAGSATIDLFRSLFVINSSNFDGGTASISISNSLTFSSSGSFDAPTGTMFIGGSFTHTSGGGTFNHNSGTIEFEGTTYNSFMNFAVSETFNNVIVDKDTTRYFDINSADTMIVEGTLTLQDGYSTNGTIEARGNVTVYETAWDGVDTTVLEFTGTGAQGLYSSGTLLDEYDGNILVNKPSGVLTLQDNVSIIGTAQEFTVQSGELDISNKILIIDDAGTGSASFFSFESGTVTVGTGGELEIADGYYAQSGGIFNLNAGTFDYNETVVDVDINAGTFNANTGTFEISDDLDISGTAQFNAGSATIDLFRSLFVINSSNFDGGTASISVSNSLTFSSSGAFDAPTGTMYIGGSFTHTSGGGTFNHNSGTIEFEGTTYNSFMSFAVSETFNNVIVDKDSTRYFNVDSADTMIVEGALTLQDGYSLNGTIEARGNVTVDQANWDGIDTSTLTFSGTGAQGLFSSGTLMDDYEGNIFVNKPSGVLTLQDDVSIIGTSQDFTVQSGELDISNKKLTIDDAGTGSASFFSFESGTVTVGTGGELEIADGYYAQSGGIFNLNAGTFDYNETVVDVDINAGTFNANTGTFETGDDLDISGTAQFNSGSATIDLFRTLNVTGSSSFDGGTASISVSNSLTFSSSGAFDAPTGTMYIGGSFTHTSGGGTFNHNSGTIEFEGTTYNSFMSFAVSETFNNVIVDKDSTRYFNVDSADTMIVEGTLTLQDGYSLNGTIEARGNVTITASTWDGVDTTALVFGGGNNQNFSGAISDHEGNISVDKTGGVVEQLAALTIDSGQTLTIIEGTYDINNFATTITDGSGSFVVQNGGALQLDGDVFPTTPTLNTGSKVIFKGNNNSGSNTYTVTDFLTTYHDLEIDSDDGSSDTFELGANLTIDGDVIMRAGRFDASASDYDIDVNGDWIKHGGNFVPQNGEVLFTGSVSQTVDADGDNFYRLVSSNTNSNGLTFSSDFTATYLHVNAAGLSSDATIYFAGGSTATVTNLNLTGDSNDTVTLKSTTTAVEWFLNNSSTNDVSYVDVQDSNASLGETITAYNNGGDLGNNTNWAFFPDQVYWIKNDTGSPGNWSTNTNWSLTSGGASCECVPGPNSHVNFDGNGISGVIVDVDVDIATLTVISAYTGGGANDGHFDNATNDRAITVSNDVTLDGKEVSMGDGAWSVGGDWDSVDVVTINVNSSSLILTSNGSGQQTLTGPATFYTLRALVSGSTVYFTAGSTISVSNTLDISGISLRSTSNGSDWYLDYSGAGSNINATNLDVRDSNASAGTAITAYNSYNRSNNTNWTFSTLSDTGVRYWRSAISSSWDTASSWSVSSGGPSIGGVPICHSHRCL